MVRKTETDREGPSSNQPQEPGYYRGITDSCISRPWKQRFLSVRKPFIMGGLGEGKRGRRLVIWRWIKRIDEGVPGTTQRLAFRNFIAGCIQNKREESPRISVTDLNQIQNYIFPVHMKWETNVWFCYENLNVQNHLGPRGTSVIWGTVLITVSL